MKPNPSPEINWRTFYYARTDWEILFIEKLSHIIVNEPWTSKDDLLARLRPLIKEETSRLLAQSAWLKAHGYPDRNPPKN